MENSRFLIEFVRAKNVLEKMPSEVFSELSSFSHGSIFETYSFFLNLS